MKKIGLLVIVFALIICFASNSFSFYLHIGQDKSEVIAGIGEPNYTEEYVDSSGKVEKCQWGSERVGTMVIIYFKNGKVISFSTKGKVR